MYTDLFLLNNVAKFAAVIKITLKLLLDVQVIVGSLLSLLNLSKGNGESKIRSVSLQTQEQAKN